MPKMLSSDVEGRQQLRMLILLPLLPPLPPLLPLPRLLLKLAFSPRKPRLQGTIRG
jgi:hypothetical protein